MIRRIVPGIAVLGLVAGLSGTLGGTSVKSLFADFRTRIRWSLRPIFGEVCQDFGGCIWPPPRKCACSCPASVSL